jgi:hypothetical protein
MTKILVQTVFFFLTFNIAYSQYDAVSNIKIGHEISPYPPLYILDGLKISQEKFSRLKIDKNCIRKIKVNEGYSYSDSTQKFNGLITVYSKLLVVLNDKSLFDSKDKIESLSKLKEDDVISLRMLNKQEALEIYGKYGKYGALIIKTE